MKIRVLHFDMKGMIPQPEYMLKLVEKIASLGYNYLLIEFEDKFPFEHFPHMVHPAAYSKDQFRTLNRKCHECGISIIPKLQSIGHLDYFLRHHSYRDLRENNNTYQWCLSNPRSFEVWTQMVKEILEVFPECEYFHIGADEVKFDTPCALCSQHDQFQLYIKRVEQCTDFIRSLGKKVLIWDDMFRKHDLSKLENLLHKVIPCVWIYRDMNEDVVHNFSRLGIEFWGASSLQTCYQLHGMSTQERRQNNVDDWAEMNEKYQIMGHIGTLWGRAQCLSPLCSNSIPQAMYMIAYLGESLLHGKIVDRPSFDSKFAKEFFGTDKFDLNRVVRYFGIEPEWVKIELEKVRGSVPKNGDIIEVWYAMNEIDVLFSYINECFDYNASLFPSYQSRMVPYRITNNFLDGVRITQERTTELENLLDKVLGPYFPEEILEEFKRQRFDAMLIQNRRWGEIITAAQKNCRL